MRSLDDVGDTFDIGGDLTVHRLGFGAMRITGPNVLGAPADVVEAHRVLTRARELGVDFVDTADAYGPGTSERLLAEAGVPDDAVVATKGGLLRSPGGTGSATAPPTTSGTPRSVVSTASASRRSIRTSTTRPIPTCP
jgi:aryl-alcohol dehydrogenase-like predicted oxidoreductase